MGVRLEILRLTAMVGGQAKGRGYWGKGIKSAINNSPKKLPSKTYKAYLDQSYKNPLLHQGGARGGCAKAIHLLRYLPTSPLDPVFTTRPTIHPVGIRIALQFRDPLQMIGSFWASNRLLYRWIIDDQIVESDKVGRDGLRKFKIRKLDLFQKIGRSECCLFW